MLINYIFINIYNIINNNKNSNFQIIDGIINNTYFFMNVFSNKKIIFLNYL